MLAPVRRHPLRFNPTAKFKDVYPALDILVVGFGGLSRRVIVTFGERAGHALFERAGNFEVVASPHLRAYVLVEPVEVPRNGGLVNSVPFGEL
ncbi:hypothetical protein [Halovenus salina]|uniref:Uncharacterized protein n=1 Tax=Halovenus salina TaxID=1510225 RepID=A0ABD5W7W1_9EURY